MGEVAALAAALAWAFASVLWARLGRETDEVTLNFLKCTLAAAALSLTLLILDGVGWPVGVSRSDLLWLAASGVAGLTLGDSAYFAALTRIGPRRALLVWALAPGLSALLAWPVLGEPIHARMVLGMVLTLGGVVWVIVERTPDDDGKASSSLSRRELMGVGFAVIALLGQASSNVLQKFAGQDAGALGLSVVRLSVGALGLGIWLGAMGRLAAAVTPMKEPAKAGRIVLATATGTYIGIWLSAYGLLHAEVGVASTLNATSPIFVLPIAATMAGDRISRRAIAGAVIAVAGVAIFFVG